MKGGKEKGKGKWRERGSTQPGPTFSLVYATPLLQHQAEIGLNPALGGSGEKKAATNGSTLMDSRLHLRAAR